MRPHHAFGYILETFYGVAFFTAPTLTDFFPLIPLTELLIMGISFSFSL